MNGNQSKTLSLMDELTNAGFGPAKVDSTLSQEDFTATLYTDPAIRLNFSDIEDTSSFNEKHLQASTPLVNSSHAPIECDDVTVDSDVLKGYTQKILHPPMLFQENIKPIPHSDESNPSFPRGIGLSLEQELQQATSQNDSTDVVSNNGCPVKSDLDVSKDLVSPCSKDSVSPCSKDLVSPCSKDLVFPCSKDLVSPCSKDLVSPCSKDLVSPCSNVGLSLEQELQQATSHNASTDVISNNGCPVKSDLDVSKDLVSPCSKDSVSPCSKDSVSPCSKDLVSPCSKDLVFLCSKDLVSPCSKDLVSPCSKDLVSPCSKDLVSPCSKDLVSPCSKDLVSPCSNVGLSLEQELQQAISQNGNAGIIDNGSPLKTDLTSSKDEIPSTDEVNLALEPQNESLNQQEDLKELEEIEPANKDSFKLENKMEISVSGKTLKLKQEPELAASSSFNNEIDKNVSEQNCISPECSGETSRYVTKNGCTQSKNNNGNSFEVLNTSEYLGFGSERLKSFSVSNTSNMAATSPVHLSKSDDNECATDSSVENNYDSVGVCNKRSIKIETCLSSTTDASPEKKTKIDSGINLNGSVSETRFPEISPKQDKLPKDDHLNFGPLESVLNKEHSDYAQLKKIEILEKQLQSEQQLTTQAAKLGMQVLEENNELKDKVEKLLRNIAKAEEERENERHANKLRLQNKDYMEQQYNEEISHLKEEISKVKQALETAEKAETKQTRQLKSMEYSAEQSQLKEQQLTTTIEHLEQLLQEKADQALHNASITFSQMDNSNTEQITAQQQEIIELQNNKTLLKSQLISHEANMKRLEEEITLCQQSKGEKEQEIDEMKSEMNSYYRTLELAQTEILDLKAQLHAAQIEKISHKDRGNSLFSEVEDRRVLAEKMVATLQRNSQALKERYDAEKQQHHKLRMQAVSLLHMNSGKVSEDYVKQLDSMLQQTKNEVKELQEKLRNYQKNEAQQTEKMVKIQKTFGTNENREFIEYLNSLNDVKQKELEEVKEKLNDMEMQYLQETNKVVDYIKKVRLTEEEAQSLRCTNMKQKLRIEELLMKYNPDELSEKTLQKTCVEKIPLGPKENIANALMKQKTRRTTQLKVPAENETKSRAQQIAELVRCGAINPVDVLKESPKAKKTVSMSSEVTVIDNDGKEEKKVNLADENIPAKLGRRPPPKGKLAPPDKIIEVKSPVHGRADCKQQ